MRGLSLRQLSDKLGKAVSHVSLAKYEQGAIKPSGQLLGQLCDALGVSPEALYRPTRVQVDTVSFRKRKAFGEAQVASLKEVVRTRLENYLEAEELVGDGIRFSLSKRVKLPDKADIGSVRAFAQRLRGEWGLGDQPIPNLIELLEANGVRVIEVEEPSREFDGCQIETYDAIVIGSRQECPVTRRRFTLAHELAHILLNAWAKQLKLTDAQLEKMVNAFASEFLFPGTALRRNFGGKRTVITIEELVYAKQQYGMSISGIVYALHELGMIGANAYRRFYAEVLSGWRQSGEIVEPGDAEVNNRFVEQPRRLQRVVFRGIAEGNLSLSRAAGLLGKPIEELRQETEPIVE